MAVSYYQYETRVGNLRGSFEQFIRTKMNRHFGSWHAHVLKAMEFSRANPQRVLLLQYERMLENTFESVKEMVIFCGIIANEARLKKTVKLCSFERLKKVESAYSSEDEYSPNMKFFMREDRGNGRFISPIANSIPLMIEKEMLYVNSII